MDQNIDRSRGALYSVAPAVLGVFGTFIGGTAEQNIKNGIGDPSMSPELAHGLLVGGLTAFVLSALLYWAASRRVI